MIKRLLREDVQDATKVLNGYETQTDEKKASLNSVDDQIDGLLIKYENESVKDSDDEEMMMESLKNCNLNFLFEEDETAQQAAQQDDSDEDEMATSDDVKSAPAAPKDSKIPLDVETFTKKVVRLIANFQNLLNVEAVILHRASEFLDKNYGSEYKDKMLDILDTQFDINLDGDEDVIDVPIATGAGVKPTGA